MKIGIFTDSYSPLTNGVAISVQATAQALRKIGHDVHIIAPSHPRYKDTEQKVYRLASIEFFTPEARFAMQLPQQSLLQAIRTDFDIIHAHNGGPVSTLGWEIARARRIPYILTYHTLLTHYAHYIFKGRVITPGMLIFISKILGNMADQIIAPTVRVKRELLSYGVNRPIHVLPTGITTDVYQDIAKGYLRKQFRLSQDTKILLYVGRLGKEKSVDFLIEAFSKIHTLHPNTVLVLVGSGSEKKNLRILSKEHGISEHVYFTGAIKHTLIPRVYADADIFVFASQTETQGMVILEALASSLPLVVVDDDAYKGFVLHGKNGFAVKKDAETFAKAVNMLLRDTKMYQLFSEAAKETAQKHSIEATAKYLEQVYKRLIKEYETKGKKRKVIIKSIEEFTSILKRTTTQVKDLTIRLRLP